MPPNKKSLKVVDIRLVKWMGYAQIYLFQGKKFIPVGINLPIQEALDLVNKVKTGQILLEDFVKTEIEDFSFSIPYSF